MVAALLLLVVADLSPADRLTPGFYGAVGPAVRVAWAVAPAAVPAGGEATLTLTVTGADPALLTAPELTALPEWGPLAGRVQVVPAGSPGPGVFAYALRPTGVGAVTVPELTYLYHPPGATADRPFRVTYAAPVTLTVTPPARTPVPVAAAEWFFTPAVEPPLAVPVWAWLVTVPVGVAVAWRAWPTRVGRLDRAARAAANRLTLAAVAADPAAAVAAVLRDYVAAATGLPAATRTPAELAAGLAARGWPAGHVREVGGLLAECDAARYGGPAGGPDLPSRARAAVLRRAGGGP